MPDEVVRAGVVTEKEVNSMLLYLNLISSDPSHDEKFVYNFADINTPIRLQGVTRKGIKIGNNCWIGSKVTILDGVEIGDGCVIAAGAVVQTSFPPNSVIGGVPARILKQRNASN